MRLNSRLLRDIKLVLSKGSNYDRHRLIVMGAPKGSRAPRMGGAGAHRRAKKFARIAGRRKKGGR